MHDLKRGDLMIVASDAGSFVERNDKHEWIHSHQCLSVGDIVTYIKSVDFGSLKDSSLYFYVENQGRIGTVWSVDVKKLSCDDR
jgi:hypothetical protein